MTKAANKGIQDIICWVITEGLAGTENQCLGIAEALGIKPVVKRIALRQPWKTFSPWLGFECVRTFDPPLEPGPGARWPDLVIASGRKSIAAARYIKKRSGGRTFTVQIQDPRVSPRQFDLVAVPEHDRLRGPNVIVTKAAPNRIFPERLAEAKQDFPALEKIRAPRIAVLIGGNSKTHRLTPDLTGKLCEDLKKLGAGLMITASRRTGEDSRKILESAFPPGPVSAGHGFLWDGMGPNPYFAFLAWADYIVVTSDSASMISEAATTGKPVYVFDLEGRSRKFDTLYGSLRAAGIIRPLGDRLEPWTYPPLNDAALLAAAIKARLKP